ncbi:kxDL motif-containing protein CG10681 isoform X2 [Scaptodrosophila lebanonensis]|uniref:KxDL motif-containing protein CG10681 isoform X2 n=1 Tax=Drosophila lebanonensis TaxID=7225 RepID=A0A6J2UA47_DROLE|nr:kxDL motif-containing protein CG10681 isoform X2 [Scaptodrosophila lebanonensis]
MTDNSGSNGGMAQDDADATPELESFEGFAAYTAAESFIQGLAGMVNQGDVETMIRAQKQMLQRFEKTNEMLLNCNSLSQNRLRTANEDFKRHVKLLNEMKKDLEYIFRKIRVIKQKLQHQYPAEYAEAQPQRSSLAEEAEDETEAMTAGAGTSSGCSTSIKPAAVIPPISETKKSNATIEYVQMEEAIDNGQPPIENELIKRVCSIETANPNDSSDCTSEDTG